MDAQQVQAFLRQQLPLYDYIGLGVEQLGETVVCSVPLSPANSSHVGTLHGAVAWALAEAVGGMLYLSHSDVLGGCQVFATEFSISFRRKMTSAVTGSAAMTGAEADALALSLDRDGRVVFTRDITLTNTSGETVATATGSYHLRRFAPA